jgi:hypothetical protein
MNKNYTKEAAVFKTEEGIEGAGGSMRMGNGIILLIWGSPE